MREYFRIALTACALAAGGCASKPSATPAGGEANVPGPMQSTPFYAPGIDRPPTEAAEAADLADDTPVVGVVVDGKARAYSLRAMSPMTKHVVNDVIGETPVTVTYCNRTNCVRVFSDEARGKSLPVTLMGFTQDSMLLRVGEVMYRQDDGKSLRPGHADFPYEPAAHELMTWKEWKTAHPGTDVYTGREPAAASATGRAGS
jgi:hypothetical protein